MSNSSSYSTTVNPTNIMKNSVLQQLNKQKPQLPIITQSIFNNTLPKPLIIKNNKSSTLKCQQSSHKSQQSSHKCQIKKNNIMIGNKQNIGFDKNELIRKKQNKQNVFQQTITKSKINKISNNYINQLNKTCSILQIQNNTQQTSRLLVNQHQLQQTSTKQKHQQQQKHKQQQKHQQQQYKQQQQQDQQQQIRYRDKCEEQNEYRLRWNKQRECYIDRIGRLEQKLRILQFQNIRLQNQLSITHIDKHFIPINYNISNNKDSNNRRDTNDKDTINNRDINIEIKQKKLGINEQQTMEFIVERVSHKVISLQSQLTFFINLSKQFKQQLSNANFTITQLNTLTQNYLNQINTLQSSNISITHQLNNLHKQNTQLQSIINTNSSNIKSYQQHIKNYQQNLKIYQKLNQTQQQNLKNLQLKDRSLQEKIESLQCVVRSLECQVCNYQYEYDKLKRQNFLLEQQYYKTCLNKQNKSYQEQYKQLKEKYECLYESYKSLYQEYINNQTNSDFINQINQSTQLNRSISLSKSNQLNKSNQVNKQYQPQITYYYPKQSLNHQQLFHCNQQNLSDSSDITNPIEPLQSRQDLNSTRPTRIILSELIKETLETQSNSTFK